MCLEEVDSRNREDKAEDRHSHTNENLPTSQGQREHGQRNEKEHGAQIERGEPSVTRCGSPEELGEADRDPAHDRNRIPQTDPSQVEEQVAQGDLQNDQLRQLNTHLSLQLYY